MWRRLFPLKDIKTALNIKPAISQEMLNIIETWVNSYVGNANWLDENIKSLGLEKAITREFANISLNEMTVSISNAKLLQIFNNAIRDLHMNFQKGLATGAMVIKPLGTDSVQFVSADAFIPVEFDSRGRLVKVIFPEFKQIEDRYYTRLEYHDLDPVKGLIITNTAYLSETKGNLGREIPLDYVEEWQSLEPYTAYPLMYKPAFGYYRNPIDNTVDNSHCGMSIFHSALDLIRLADIQFSRLDWEFESGERAIHIDVAALATGKDGKRNTVAHLNKRLYRSVDIMSGGDSELFKEFSPQLRQADLIAGLNEYKRNIEFSVGLAYGDISDPNTVAKTATEIKSAKDRKYNTVTAIQQNLKDCLEDLSYALAFYNALTTSNYTFTCTFKDSILTDEEAERKQDIQDLNLGILNPWEYRAKWYGEDEKTALANLPQPAEVVE